MFPQQVVLAVQKTLGSQAGRWHIPAKHIEALASQTLPQAPQLNGSFVGLMHLRSQHNRPGTGQETPPQSMPPAPPRPPPAVPAVPVVPAVVVVPAPVLLPAQPALLPPWLPLPPAPLIGSVEVPAVPVVGVASSPQLIAKSERPAVARMKGPVNTREGLEDVRM